MSASTEDPEGIAAEVALVALRATMPSPDVDRREAFVMLPHTAPVDRATAIRVLMQQPKPVSCLAIDLYGMTGIACWPQPVAKSRLPANEWAAHARQHREATRRRLASAYQSTRVLVIGQAERLDITLEQLWAWEDRYDLLFDTVLIDENDQRARAAGAAAAVTFSRPPRGAMTLDAAGSGGHRRVGPP
jgi:hypothetical protein